MTRVLHETLADALAASAVEDKLARVGALAADRATGKTETAPVWPVPPETARGRPARPLLVAPKDLPTRRPGSPDGLPALIHAVAHIEWCAIDLALDHAYRFPGQPDEYYADWIGVAAEEAGHFVLLRDHLRSQGRDYGDFPAHDSLWQLNVRTGHDLVARMALVPRLMEARGLDATPPIQAKLEQAGDLAGARILDIILRDEIGHVGLGDKWFRRFCADRGLDAEAEYGRLIVEYRAPRPVAPVNLAARAAAGFSPAELERMGGRP
ncbi:MAG: ferritin-like domain-containing protein [Proteobacteria bacterium]|nr:ferritin-like domain-containing protein [Pseudomonadota bacterium]HQR04917.1 ferritin-like domain-containing protein [Rhodocyclaceae bacterium]